MSHLDLVVKLVELTIVGAAAVICASAAWRSQLGKVSLMGIFAGVALLAVLTAREKLRCDIALTERLRSESHRRILLVEQVGAEVAYFCTRLDQWLEKEIPSND